MITIKAEPAVTETAGDRYGGVMKTHLLPMILLAGCVAAPEPAPAPTQSALHDGFVGQRFAWSHVSGVSGETIHHPGGTMVYDSNGRERISQWTLSVDDRYCMNAGEYEQVCFTLVPTPTGYASQDGTFRYDRLPEPPGPPLDAMAPFDAPYDAYDTFDAYDAPYDTPYDGTFGASYEDPYAAPAGGGVFGNPSDLPIVSSPID